MPDFEPSSALAGWNWEDIPGVPRATGLHYGQIDGEGFATNALVVERTVITRDAEETEGLDGKLEATGNEWRADTFNPAADWWFFAALFGKASTAAHPTVPDVYLHRFSRSESSITFPGSQTIYIARDDGAPHRIMGARASVFTLQFRERALQSASLSFVSPAGDYFGDAVRTAGAGTTGFPIVRGFLSSQLDLDVTDQNFHFEVTAFDATTITRKVKLGDGDAFGAAEVVPRGRWVAIVDEAGVEQGSLGRPVQEYWPLTVDFQVGDIFKVDSRRPEWTPTFSVNAPVNEVLSTLKIDGEDFEVESGTLTITRPAEAKYGFGGRVARRARQRGQQTAELTFSREVLDLKPRRLLESSGAPFSFDLHLRSEVPVIPAGDPRVDHYLRLIAKRCKISGSTATVQDRATYNESITARCHPNDDPTYPAAITAIIQNDVADILAA